MDIRELKVGTSILIDIERGGIIYTLKSKVMDTSTTDITILPPYDNKGDITELRKRDKVHVRYAENKRILRWECDAWEDTVIEGQKYVRISANGVAENANKREALRLSVGKEVTIKSIRTLETTEVVLKDVSLVGVGIVTTGVFKTGEIFDLTLEDFNHTIPLRIKVIREVTLGDKRLYGCIITKSDKHLRNYITGRQQEEIRKLRAKESGELN